MGLDMYLSANIYVGAWGHSGDAAREQYRKITEALGLGSEVLCIGAPSLTVSVNVAYWRKANAVHAWFVDECGGGVDECQEIEVSKEQLATLVETCKAALIAYENGETDLAAETLAPESGFFFGSTEIDEWYAEDLHHTIKTLEPLITDDRFPYFTYQASW